MLRTTAGVGGQAATGVGGQATADANVQATAGVGGQSGTNANVQATAGVGDQATTGANGNYRFTVIHTTLLMEKYFSKAFVQQTELILRKNDK